MRNYPAKLLLFGEHILLQGAAALAVPAPKFVGHWSDVSAHSKQDDHPSLMPFAQSQQLKALDDLDLPLFLAELGNGLFFDSSIPIGYGLGSSGALCAAVYHRYCREKTSDASELKRLFAQMEGFFHGSSSGVDALTSYLNQPVLIKAIHEVSAPTCKNWGQEAPVVFLIDSGLPRQTAPMVRWFQEMCAVPDNLSRLQHAYLPAHESLVNAWIGADKQAFWESLRVVSNFQFQHFGPLIPGSLQQLWARELNNTDLLFKLCGAGGGGFLLGFSSNPEKLEAIKAAYSVVFPFEK
jgi:mevalonate kinase